jgi:hypothetical protein
MNPKTRGALSLAIALLLAAAFQPALAQESENLLQVEVAGLIAFVPSTSGTGASVLLVNGYDEDLRPHGMQHFPVLEIRCEDLVDVKARGACESKAHPWGETKFRMGTRDNGVTSDFAEYSLDKGFDIVFRTSDARALSGNLLGIKALERRLPKMSALGENLGTVRSEALVKASSGNARDLRRLVVARAQFPAGKVQRGEVDPRETWAFVNRRGARKASMRKIPSSIFWSVPAVGRTVRVELRPYDGSQAVILDLAPDALDRTLRIAILNGPTKDAFCAHEPDAWRPVAGDFEAFYRLIQSETKKHDRVLPVYRANTLKLPCSDIELMTRPPIICMMPAFEPANVDW